MGNVLTGQRAETAFVKWYHETYHSTSRLQQCDEMIVSLKKQIQIREDLIESMKHGWATLAIRKRRRVGGAQKELVQLYARLRRVTAERSTMEIQPLRTLAQTLYRRSCNVPRVRAIDVIMPMTWRVWTRTLFCRDPYSLAWHRIGPFTIDIDLTAGPNFIWWRNQEGPRQNMVAPQIRMPGKGMCLGNALQPMEDAFRERNYDSLVSIAVRFAECAAPHQEYAKVLAYWPIVCVERVPRWYRETQLQW